MSRLTSTAGAPAGGCPSARTASPSAAPAADEQQAFGEQLAREAPAATRRAPRRTLSSCRRAVARASSRLAMLAQAISSTSADDGHEREQRSLVVAARSSEWPAAAGTRVNGRCRYCRSVLRAANPAAAWPRESAAARREARAVAASIVCPGFRRSHDVEPPPRALSRARDSVAAERAARCRAARRRRTRGRRSGPKKSGGVTPMIVNGTRFERERPADDVGRAAEPPLPEA